MSLGGGDKWLEQQDRFGFNLDVCKHHETRVTLRVKGGQESGVVKLCLRTLRTRRPCNSSRRTSASFRRACDAPPAPVSSERSWIRTVRAAVLASSA